MIPSRNIKLVIEYDGTNYCGWQVQPNGPTIQSEIEKALREITGERVRIHGAGRTDAGVHARGQVASFMTGSQLPPQRLLNALNAVLAPDIAIITVEEAPASFHARYSAKSKRYRYVIVQRSVRSALERNRAFHIPEPLDYIAMADAGSMLVGTKDLSSFGCNAGRDDNPVRTVMGITVKKQEEMLVIEMEAVSFLYKMARSIAGTLIEVGRGKLTPADFKRILHARDRGSASPTAPAHGLYLVKVSYS